MKRKSIISSLIGIVMSQFAWNVLIAQTNSFPLYSSGTYTPNGSGGDATDAINPQFKLQSVSGYIRVVHKSQDASASAVYNFETGKDAFWGESSDVGNYYFRGRNLIAYEGKVGFGTTTPSTKLDVNGTIHTSGGIVSDVQSSSTLSGWFRGPASGNANVVIQGGAGTYAAFWLTAADVLKIGGSGGSEPSVGAINITTNSNVGIGTKTPGSNKLAVEGTIGARKVVVTLAAPFPDYVFQKGYQLPSLASVAEYINKHSHLPEMPSADSVQKNGLDLGGNQVMLLKKIEELTLYAIEQQKQIKKLQNELAVKNAENKRIQDLQDQINELKALIKK